jgi:hypothetical protein
LATAMTTLISRDITLKLYSMNAKLRRNSKVGRKQKCSGEGAALQIEEIGEKRKPDD